MPRRNNRTGQAFEPLDLTPADIQEMQRSQAEARKARRGIPPRLIRAERDMVESERAARQRNARINGGIDWSVCLVPGCGEELIIHSRGKFAPSARNHKTSLPLCYIHLGVAHQQGSLRVHDELMVLASARVLQWKREENVELEEAAQKAWVAKRDGFIYYVRLNGLIKAGWTRDLHERLRAYGPDVEILAHYPATRDDETYLHRQLRPFLAKGREWYQDCQALHDFVAKAVEDHGPPTVTPMWSVPKEVIRPRRRSA